MKVRNRLFGVIVMLITSLCCISAQEVSIGINFLSATGETEEYFDIPVQSTDGTWHAIEKINSEITLSVSDNKYSLVKYSLVLKRGTTTEQSLTEQTNPKIEFKGLNKTGSYTIELSNIVLSYKDDDETKEVTLYDEESFQAASFKLELYDVPEISDENISELSQEVVWNTTEREFSVTANDGNESGWEYSWYIDGSRQSVTNNEWSGTFSVNENRPQVFKVVVVNMAPDGNTEWYHAEYEREYTVYQTPSAELIYNGSLCPQTMDWYCEDNNVDYIRVQTDGGSSNWDYKWKYNGREYSGESFKPTLANNAVTTNSYSVYDYSLILANKPEGMSDDLIKEGEKELKGNIRFWKTPKVEFDNTEYKAVFEGNEVYLTLESTSGNPNGWVFESSQITLNQNGNTYSFTSTQIDNDTVNVVYDIAYTNTLEGNYSSISGNTSISIQVWDTPEVTPYYISNNPELGDNKYQLKNNNIYVNEEFGGKVTLGANTSKGDSGAWSYNWQLIDHYQNYNQEGPTLDVSIEGIESKVYLLTVTNKPDNVKVAFEESFEITLNALQQPSYNIQSGSSEYAAIAGQSVKPQFGTIGGYSSGWKSVWIDEQGDTISENYDASISVPSDLSEKKTVSYTVILSNYGPEGDIWYGGSSDENVEIVIYQYPVPTNFGAGFIGFENERIDVYYGSDKYNVAFTLGEYNKVVPEAVWTYKVHYINNDGDLLVSNDSVHNIIINQPLGINHTYTNVMMEVKCIITDPATGTILNAYDNNNSLHYHSWSKGSAKVEPYVMHIPYGQQVILNSIIEGGYDGGVTGEGESNTFGGWYFEWRDANNDIIPSANESVFTYINDYEVGNPKPVTYYLYCKNELDGEIGYEDTLQYTYTHYSRPIDATISGEYVKHIRQGDQITLRVNVPGGANIHGWQYTWSGSNEWYPIEYRETVIENTFTVNISDGNVPTSNRQTKIFYFRNVMPDNESVIWSSGEVEFDYTVYRRPHEPRFMKKGNATSHLYIAIVDNAVRVDESNYEHYRFEYGQYDDGVYVANSLTSNMFYRYPGSSLPIRPYVRSLWRYTLNNGEYFDCYSDYVFLNTKTRAELKELTIENGSFHAILEEELPALLLVYSTEGKVVMQKEYPPQTEFSEEINLGELNSGVYLVKCIIGRQQVVKKMLVQ